MYSSPRAPRSWASSACAGPPTHRGCQALKTSCWKPGSVSSAVLIAPPSSASRSSTQTFQPARASRAAHASELMPLPTTTASWSATGEAPELFVRDEAALLCSERLDAGEQIPLLLLVEIEAQLGGLDPDRVDAALLAEHDPALGGDDLRGVGLDRRRIVELARDRARLAGEEVVADQRLVRLEPVA